MVKNLFPLNQPLVTWGVSKQEVLLLATLCIQIVLHRALQPWVCY